MEIAAQLYVFTKTPELEARTPEVLAALADAGYTAVEGMNGRPPFQKAELEPFGLCYLATHRTTGQLSPLNETIADAQAKGASSVVVSGLIQWQERTAQDYRDAVPVLNAAGQRLRDEAGLALYYHNHDFEFLEVEPGRTGMEILLDGLDSAAVKLCLDAGWAVMAGIDLPAFFQQHGDRLGMIHLRDFRSTASVPLGQGDLDLAAVVAALPVLPPLVALTVEQDPDTTTPLDDMIASRQYLRKIFSL